MWLNSTKIPKQMLEEIRLVFTIFLRYVGIDDIFPFVAIMQKNDLRNLKPYIFEPVDMKTIVAKECKCMGWVDILAEKKADVELSKSSKESNRSRKKSTSSRNSKMQRKSRTSKGSSDSSRSKGSSRAHANSQARISEEKGDSALAEMIPSREDPVDGGNEGPLPGQSESLNLSNMDNIGKSETVAGNTSSADEKISLLNLKKCIKISSQKQLAVVLTPDQALANFGSCLGLLKRRNSFVNLKDSKTSDYMYDEASQSCNDHIKPVSEKMQSNWCQNEDGGGKQLNQVSIEDTDHYPLQDSWNIYHMDQKYDVKLISPDTINTAGVFWQYMNNLPDLGMQDSYAFWKAGGEPRWESPENSGGGRLRMYLFSTGHYGSTMESRNLMSEAEEGEERPAMKQWMFMLAWLVSNQEARVIDRLSGCLLKRVSYKRYCMDIWFRSNFTIAGGFPSFLRAIRKWNHEHKLGWSMAWKYEFFDDHML